MNLQPDLLEQIFDIHLAFEPPSHLKPNQESHVVAVTLQQTPQRRAVARFCQDQQELGVELGIAIRIVFV